MEWDFRKGGEYNIKANKSGWIGLKEPEDEDFCPGHGSTTSTRDTSMSPTTH